MTRKKRESRRASGEDLGEIAEQGVNTPAIDLDPGLDNLLAQLGEIPGESKVYIYRKRTGIRPPFAFLDATTASEFDVRDVKARFGGGEFFVRAWTPGVQGPVINQSFAIEGEPIVQGAGFGPASAQPQVINPGAPGSPPILMLPGGNQQVPVYAIGQMIQAAIGELGKVIAPALAPRDPQREFTQVLTMISAFRQAMGDNGQSNPLGMLKEVMGIMREADPIRGEGGHADGYTILQTAVEKILPALIARSTQMQLPLRPPPVPPEHRVQATGGGGPTTIAEAARAADMARPAPVNAPEPARPVASVPPDVVEALNMIVKFANTVPPEVGVNAMLDFLEAHTEEEERQVLAFLQAPDWFTQVCAIAPAAANHAAWFASARAQLIEAITAPPEGDDDGLTGADGEGISEPERAAYTGDAPFGRH